MTLSVPVEPDAPDARELLLNELTDPAYAESQPTWFDLVTQAVLDWLGSLRLAGGEGPPALAFAIGGIVLAAAIIVALLIYGVPRWRTRSRLQVGDLLGENDRRTARQLRRDAERAAAASDWPLAIAERYRAIARSLDERTIVAALPGTTAHGFARAAARQFPDHRSELSAAADRFDEVRYLGQPGSADGYAFVRALDETLEAARSPLPAVDAFAAAGAS
ncbi:DUF4129 domain-containing protein [Microcella sp.]|uniref:DUF4129 domain-containing protein n=1 Tax=Microcella sp. TaxID=1913979 RepID=UPI00299F53D7|nr:DUF4129 domain-containing protein [Microcella sp.]MDX2026811.1 DUF4129 domain-containing protein [Microcella sp.]